MTDIRDIVNEFRIDGIPSGFERTGSGHINDSYHITMDPPLSKEYLLQRINHNVFTDVPALMENIVKVTNHISGKLALGDEKMRFRELRLIRTKNNAFFHKDGSGNYWRMYNHIEGSRSFDLVPGPELAYEGGKAFGLFLKMTSDMEAAGLSETIRDFHNIETRMAAFRKACDTDPLNRAAGVKNEIRFIEERADEMHAILRLGRSGQIPLRVTHNDTKFNNILFDKRNKAICIIDLDTVMPGYVLYDFGDAIRTSTNTGAEDEADPGKVMIDLRLFSSYSRGFLEMAGGLLNKIEKDHLAFSCRFMTFIIGLRFLTDHIAGDTYFKIHFPGHNLQRARAQLRLVRAMEENALSMEKIISDLCKNPSEE